MRHSIAYIAAELRAARKKKGLSQRDLVAKTGVPQSHISKIENGTIDLQTSSLVEIARALDLELMLVPRNKVVTLQALLRGESGKQIPAYRLDEEEENV